MQDELPCLINNFNEFQQFSRENVLPASMFDDTNVSDNMNLSQHSPRAMVKVCFYFSFSDQKIFEIFAFLFIIQMMQRVRNVQYAGDPSTLPARSNEIEYFVRIFYKLSHFINEKVFITLKII